MPAKDVPRIRNLLDRGLTLQQISEAVGVSRSTIYRTIRAHNLRGPGHRRQGRPIDQQTEERIFSELTRDPRPPIAEIARRCGVSTHAVRQRDRSGRRRLEQPRRCPVHGPMLLWPCLACDVARDKEAA